jgi:hypothetical protein
MPTYETTAKQKQQLLKDGYTVLPKALPSELLARWRNLADLLEDNALKAHQRGENTHGACVIEDPVGSRLMRYNDVLSVDTGAALDLLSCPAMMAIFQELCGCGAVPLQMDILYKHQHPHPVILWHQGSPHERKYPYLNVGVYLDDASLGDGCLRYVPNTQHEKKDICKLSKNYGWEIPGVVEQPAKAGDIFVQDMMILHGSQPKRTSGVRRTIYIEIRPAIAILETGVQSKQWMELRKRWMGLILRRANPSDWPKDWQEDISIELQSDEEEISKILSHKEPPIPAYYCHQKIEVEGYPVPEDMK